MNNKLNRPKAIPFTVVVVAVLLGAGTLAVPGVLAVQALGEGSVWRVTVSALAWLLLVAAIAALLPAKWPWKLLVSMVLVLLALVRIAYMGVAQFSGAGFTPEFFLHLEFDALKVAIDEFTALFLLSGVLLPVLLVLSYLALSVIRNRLAIHAATALLLVSSGALVAMHSQLPEWRLVDGWRQWHAPVAPPLAASEMALWRNADFVTADLPAKNRLDASAPPRPRNLILVYLESVGASVVDHPDWPDLMPRLRDMQAKHALVRDFHTSGYITIEGIVNSQCGTLFPFQRGSDSLSEADGLAERMTCLGDVLAKAGYRQSYLGGANLGFAGKGQFLGKHGYNTLLGLNEWRQRGLNQRPGTWGLSDADLFGQALEEIDVLQQDGRPFNLTLLTIGTHLPGYRYAECAPYRHDEADFLQALHCTDQLLATWLETLESRGILENTLVVVTADHSVFRNAEMRRLFGDSVLEDRRLPLLVMGAGAPGGSIETGAQYDLAPTVLDLLGVEHNAEFALGRSLLVEDDRDFFVSRYAQVYDGELLPRALAGCQAGVPVPPLDHCERAQLDRMLRAQVDGLSTGADYLRCDSAIPIEVGISTAADAPTVIQVNGHDQIARFSWRSRPVSGRDQGLFLMSVHADDGRVVRRQFIPATQQSDPIMQVRPEVESDQRLLVVWRGGAESSPPAWFPDSAMAHAVYSITPATSGARMTELASTDPAIALNWRADEARCQYLLN
ncbi:LTA synthase family protein [Parahaliea mediterranea]|uniref:LTA synthase family protein n=1 Tax=Parahaliea mediterranea TaxID=651086 RepID=A0A939IIW4_9GAMM|nr:LTA synthase family protein [Parahaliea mediterranea]MBN7795661.1 LTA synthase family protein [Parahaliea mediterranea]